MQSRLAVERALVCAAFSGRETLDKIASRVTAVDFADLPMRTVWSTLVALNESGSSFDPVLVIDMMAKRSSVHDGVGMQLLVELSASTWESAHLEHYCDILQKYSATDEAHAIAARLQTEAVVDEKIIDSYIVKLDAIRRGRKDEVKTAEDAVIGLQERKANPLVIHRTGIPMLDDRLRGGLRDGQVTVIGGRPGSGKSVLLTQIAVSIAERGEGALIVTLEMLKEEIADRLSRTRSLEHIAGLPLYFIDSTSDLGVISSLVKVASRRYKLGVVVVDYLQLAEVSGAGNENRERQIATISRRLKRLAMDLQTPVIVGSQLNRESTKRNKPTLADLRESGAIEQDADNVILLSKSDDGPEMIVDIAKQRGGGTGEIVMRLDGPKFQFVVDDVIDGADSRWK